MECLKIAPRAGSRSSLPHSTAGDLTSPLGPSCPNYDFYSASGTAATVQLRELTLIPMCPGGKAALFFARIRSGQKRCHAAI